MVWRKAEDFQQNQLLSEALWEFGDAAELLGPKQRHSALTTQLSSTILGQPVHYSAQPQLRKGLSVAGRLHPFVDVDPAEEPLTDEDLDMDGSAVEDGWPGPQKPKPLSSISLSFHSEEPRTLDPDNLVPIATVGSSFVLTATGARLDQLERQPWHEEDGHWDPTMWGPRSLLSGKLVHFTSKQAAIEALRARVWPPANISAGSHPAEKRPAGKSAAADVPVLEETQGEVGRVKGVQQYWRVWEVPPQAQAQPWRAGDKNMGGLSRTWNKAVKEERQADFKASESQTAQLKLQSAKLIQIPLLFSIFNLRFNKAVQKLYTLCSSSHDIVKEREGRSRGGRRGKDRVDLAVYSIPGMWVLAPSSQGFVHFAPHFFSTKELDSAWKAAGKLRLSQFLRQREKKRLRSAEFIQRQMGKWAADQTGLSRPPPPAESSTSDNEPPELRALLQEMGMAHPPAAQAAPQNVLLTPLKFMAVAVCGAAVLGTEMLHSLQSTGDKLWFHSPLGRRQVLGANNKPVPQIRSLREVVMETKKHNKRAQAIRKAKSKKATNMAGRLDDEAAKARTPGHVNGPHGLVPQAANGAASPATTLPEHSPEGAPGSNTEAGEFRTGGAAGPAEHTQARSEDPSAVGTNPAASQYSQESSRQRSNGEESFSSTSRQPERPGEVSRSPQGETSTGGEGGRSGDDSSAESQPSTSGRSPEDEFARMGLKMMKAAEESLKKQVKSMTLDALEGQTVVEKLKKASSLSSVVRRCPTDGHLEPGEHDTRFLQGLSQVASSLCLAAFRSGLLMTPLSPLSPSANSLPLGAAFQPLKAPSGIHRWLLQVPAHKQDATLLEFLEGRQTPKSDNSPRAEYAVVSADMNKITGKDSEQEYVPQNILRGVLLVGALGLDTDAQNPFPSDLSVGIANATSLDEDLEDWP